MTQELGVALEKLVLLLISIIPTIILLIEKIITFKIKRGSCIKKETTDIEMIKMLKRQFPNATIEELTTQVLRLKQENYKEIIGEKKNEKDTNKTDN